MDFFPPDPVDLNYFFILLPSLISLSFLAQFYSYGFLPPLILYPQDWSKTMLYNVIILIL